MSEWPRQQSLGLVLDAAPNGPFCVYVFCICILFLLTQPQMTSKSTDERSTPPNTGRSESATVSANLNRMPVISMRYGLSWNSSVQAESLDGVEEKLVANDAALEAANRRCSTLALELQQVRDHVAVVSKALVRIERHCQRGHRRSPLFGRRLRLSGAALK